MTFEEEYTKKLKDCGLKITNGRKSVIQVLADSKIPLSADEIYSTLNNANKDINLSTVYRILELLSSKNIVTKINFIGNSHMLYEYNNMIHKHYLVCTKCKKIYSICHCPLKEYEKEVEKDSGFTITGHSLFLYGLCKKCKGNN